MSLDLHPLSRKLISWAVCDCISAISIWWGGCCWPCQAWVMRSAGLIYYSELLSDLLSAGSKNAACSLVEFCVKSVSCTDNIITNSCESHLSLQKCTHFEADEVPRVACTNVWTLQDRVYTLSCWWSRTCGFPSNSHLKLCISFPVLWCWDSWRLGSRVNRHLSPLPLRFFCRDSCSLSVHSVYTVNALSVVTVALPQLHVGICWIQNKLEQRPINTQMVFSEVVTDSGKKKPLSPKDFKNIFWLQVWCRARQSQTSMFSVPNRNKKEPGKVNKEMVTWNFRSVVDI